MRTNASDVIAVVHLTFWLANIPLAPGYLSATTISPGTFLAWHLHIKSDTVNLVRVFGRNVAEMSLKPAFVVIAYILVLFLSVCCRTGTYI